MLDVTILKSFVANFEFFEQYNVLRRSAFCVEIESDKTTRRFIEVSSSMGNSCALSLTHFKREYFFNNLSFLNINSGTYSFKSSSEGEPQYLK